MDTKTVESGNEELKIVCMTVFLTALTLFAALLLHNLLRNQCVETLKDKPTAEIAQVCK